MENLLTTALCVGGIAIASVGVHKMLAKNSVRKDEPPLVTGNVPYLGVALQYASNPRQFLIDTRKQYGDIFSLYMGGGVITVVFDQEWISSVFFKAKPDHMSFFKPIEGIGFDKLIGGDAPIEEIGTPLANLMVHSMVPAYTHFFESIGGIIDSYLKFDIESTSTDGKYYIHTFMPYLMSRLIVRVLCEPEANNKEFVEAVREFEDVAQKLIHSVGPMYRWRRKRGFDLVATIKGLLKKEFVKRRARYQVDGKPQRVRDFTDALLMHEYSEKGDEWMSSASMGFVFGGLSNTNLVAEYLLALLGEDSTLRSKIIDEVDKMCNAHNGVISYECLSELPVLEGCIMELTRINSGLANARTLMRDSTAKAGDKEYFLPEGRMVLAATHHIMTEGEFGYYPEPQVFDPLRYSSSEAVSKHLGFGAKVHKCKGIVLAKIELHLLAIHLLHYYDVEGSEGDIWKNLEFITMSGLPVPRETIKLRMKRRNSPRFNIKKLQ